MPFTILRCDNSKYSLFRVLSWRDIEFCQIFLCLLRGYCDFLSRIPFMLCITFDLYMLNHLYLIMVHDFWPLSVITMYDLLNVLLNASCTVSKEWISCFIDPVCYSLVSISLVSSLIFIVFISVGFVLFYYYFSKILRYNFKLSEVSLGFFKISTF